MIEKNIVNKENDDDFLVIPMKKKQLGDFITSLLGQPQSIDREIFGHIDVDHQWFVNLIESLHQRIVGQTESKLTSFNIEIGYSNKEFRTLNSYEEFLHYNENRSLYSSSIKISLAYLVQFPRKENPEPQKIEIRISESSPVTDKSGSFSRSSITRETAYVSYKIAFTERTWGEDIDKIINDHLDKIIISQSKGTYIGKLLLLLSSTILSIFSLFSPLVIHEISSISQKNKLIKRLTELPVTTDSEKIDYLYELLSTETSSDGLSFANMIIGAISAGAIIFLGSLLLTRRKPSFIVLTSHDKSNRKTKLDKRKLKGGLTILGYVISILTGVLSNFIFMLITKS